MPGAAADARHYVTAEDYDPRSRFVLYRLCDCPTCEGRGKAWIDTYGSVTGELKRCLDCRGEGRIQQEVASCESPEAVGVTLVTLGREGEWEECPFGLLDRYPACETCNGERYLERSWIEHGSDQPCPDCNATGRKPTGTWLILPWLPSPRNVSDAGRVLGTARKRGARSS